MNLLSLVHQGLTVQVLHQDSFNYALEHNRVPVLSSVQLRAEETAGTETLDLALRLSIDPVGPVEVAQALEIPLPSVPAGEEAVLPARQISWNLEHAAFLTITETASTTLRAELVDRSQESRLSTGTAAVRVLPAELWSPEGIRESLAAYIRPRDPIIEELLTEASAALTEHTGSGEMPGYAGGPERVELTARGIYHALAMRGLAASPSATDHQQRIRSHTDVLKTRQASSLEAACLFAAALSRAGLHAVVAVTGRHALVGWLAEHSHLSTTVVDQPNVIATLADSELLEVIEVTGMTTTNQGSDFDMAGSQAARWWTSYEQEGLWLLDVAAAHRRIRPLPNLRFDGETLVVETVQEGNHHRWRSSPPGSKASAHPTSSPSIQTAEARKAPARIEQWRRALLDLSYRNPLLRLAKSSSAPVHVPAGSLNALMEQLVAGNKFELSEHGDIEQIHQAQGARTAADVDPETLSRILIEERRIFAILGFSEFEKRLRSLQRRANTTAEETGAHPLYCAIGALRWEDPGGKRGGHAPLFLVPVTLTGGRRSPFRVEYDDSREIVPNISALEKLRTDMGLTLQALADPPRTSEGLIDLHTALSGIRRSLLKERAEQITVEETAHLALLQFSTLDLWRDLSEHWEVFMRRDHIRHLVETPGAQFDDGVGSPEPVPEEEATLHLPVPADASQIRAVSWAAAGKSFILEGPPGTGKSQTITNLIAENLARGKKVLFVAEKQVALDVVQRRLEEVGLADFCLDLHGKNQSVSAVRAQIRAALEANPAPEVAFETTRARLRNAVEYLARYPQALHSAGPAGLSAWQARQLVLELAEHEDTVDPDDDPLVLTPEQAPRLGALEEACSRAAEVDRDLLQLQAPIAEHPWALAEPAATTALDQHRSQFSAILTATLEAEHGTDGSPAHALMDLALTVEQTDAVITWLESLVSGFRTSAFGLDLPSLITQAKDIDQRWFPIGRGRSRRKLLRGIEEHLTGPEALAVEELTSRLEALSQLKAQWERLHLVFAEESPSTREQVAALTAEIYRDGSPISYPAESLRQRATAWTSMLELLGATSRSLHRWAGTQSRKEAIDRCAAAWSADLNTGMTSLDRWAQVSAGLDWLHRHGLENWVRALQQERLLPGDLEPSLRQALTDASLAERLESTGLVRFDETRHLRRIEQFGSASSAHRELLSRQLPADLVASRSFDPHASLGRVGQLRTQAGRRRGGLSIRGLFEHFGSLITEAAPCLLMSPDSVARFLPPESVEVDLVVFDEASQIRVPEAIGAMGRAKSVVIVGDTKQMPPSSTFSARTADEASGAGDELPVPADMDSILSEAAEAGFPRQWLSWHYRSRDESLIAFSNQQYYEDRLSTFPAPPQAEGSSAVQLRHIGGLWEGGRGGARVNRAEAEAVVAEVDLLLQEQPERSIGVVTFNIQQRDLILDLLEEHSSSAVREALIRDEDPVFVKNLENVQGDERDVILFTLAISADERGRVPLNFGALSGAGGERRLNVAITRAREQVIIFTSFRPQQLDVSTSASQGLHDLREYLLTAEYGTAQLGSGSAQTSLDRHSETVATALEAAGLEVRRRVGLSDFTVDLAARSGPERPWVAVLLDGPQWAARGTVGDRELLPSVILQGLMSWAAVERVWLPAWLKDPELVVERICRVAAGPDQPRDSGDQPGAEESPPATQPQPDRGAEASNGPAPIQVQQQHVADAPIDELLGVFVAVIRRAHGAPRDEAQREVARLYGHQKMGSRISARMQEVTDLALSQGRIQEQDGLLTAVGE